MEFKVSRYCGAKRHSKNSDDWIPNVSRSGYEWIWGQFPLTISGVTDKIVMWAIPKDNA